MLTAAAQSAREEARIVFFSGKQPRDTWLCVNCDGYGVHSLRTYFDTLSGPTFARLFEAMGWRP